ncbi:MAG: formylmethanofuran dehydrogenase subunit B [Pseudonocardia sp.]|nr:formylmethanofuran dehydrogenase subunit B [Pseudonocardia sp.]
MTGRRVVADVACTGCGCVCDDLRITVAGNRVVAAEGACYLVHDWFLRQDGGPAPGALLDGKPATLREGYDRAAEILGRARMPVLFGLSRSATEGQQEAVALADRLGAVVDTTASLEHAPSVLALQEAGESTCSLGEVRNRADLVIFWGADPMVTHPRHFERYSVDPPGRFVPAGRADRFVVVVASGPNVSAERADLFLPVKRGHDFEALASLRALVAGVPLEPGAETGLPRGDLEALAARMKACRCGALFFGVGLSLGKLGHRSVEALLRLVQELNAFTPFYARRLRVHGDVTGADLVLAWQSGYPFAVSFARGYPRYEPGEFSAHEVLRRGEADACVIVGSERLVDFSPEAIAFLATIPTVVLDYPGVECPVRPTVQFTTAVYGVHAPGTVYRMDEIPIPLRAFLQTELPTDAEVLREIRGLLPV